MDAEVASDLRAHGGDLNTLLALARDAPRADLSEALKILGYTKMGARKKVEQALVAEAATAPSSAAPVEPAALASPAPTATGANDETPANPPASAPALPPAADADSLQAAGTEAFKAGAHERAAALYGEALALRPGDATLFSNRSAALLLLGRNEAALNDAVEAVRLRPSCTHAACRTLHVPHADCRTLIAARCTLIAARAPRLSETFCGAQAV